jgi:general secretion pathway protein D
MIEAALRHLDIVPLQVLIEASVVEVTLTDDLQYGVQWFFKNHFGGGHRGIGISGRAPVGRLREAADLGGRIGNIFGGGFTYALLNSRGEISVILDALAAATKVNVLSSPSLMVLDNQTAAITVADEVPVRTTEVQQITAGDAPVVSGIEYKDAGVILEVTPRINIGGRITLELVQEVTDVVSLTAGVGQNPTFKKRNIQSTVTVQSGDTLTLGGLIQEDKDFSKRGIPLLSDLPLLGPLFSTTEKIMNRTELIVLLTPKAVRSQEESRTVTEEFRQRLKELETITPEGYYRREKGL